MYTKLTTRFQLLAEKDEAEKAYERAIKANKNFEELKKIKERIRIINIELTKEEGNTDESRYELNRLDSLQKYNILDSLTEEEYDDITFLAAHICNTPVSLISFVDKERQWFKSNYGVDAKETEKEHSFCLHALQKPDELMVVNDSREDDRFKNNPLVTGYPNVIFYAGFPLVNRDGYGLGSVCVIDNKPRELSAEQLKALKILSRQVMRMLEERRDTVEKSL